VDVEVFDVAYRIIGGGEEGDRRVVRTKEDADHSLPYLAAVALLDGEVMPEQYRPARIRGDDVQALLRRVTVTPHEGFSRRFPAEMPCRVQLTLRDGRVLTAERADYPGFTTRGRTWEAAQEKFERLSEPYTTPALRDRIAATVSELERYRLADLTDLLGGVGLPTASADTEDRTP
jgi:2-methylcitrate dehydratase